MEANFRRFINNTFMKWKKKVAHNFDKKKKKNENLRLKITFMR